MIKTDFACASSFGRLLRTLLLAASLAGVSASDALAGPEETLSPITAVPAGTITVDGDLAEWDFTGSQVAYVAGEFLDKENGESVFAYDDEALYFAARVADPTPMRNNHNASGRFWEGDCITLRLYSKLKDNQRVPTRTSKDSDSPTRVVHLSFFQQHNTGANWIVAAYGAAMGKKKINPEGIDSAFLEFPDKTGYAFEAKIPWSALNVPAPPQPGETMRVLVQLDFGNAVGDHRIHSTPAAYLSNPGNFGFLKTNSWGYLEFSGKPLTKRMWPDPAQLLAAFKKPRGGQPVLVDLPEAGQVTINIYEPKSGRLVRELVEDRILPKGKNSLLWDGTTNTGENAPLGDYDYTVLVHQEIRAHYLGSVGSSGVPPYANEAGVGEWGGDHSAPLAVTIDPQGTTLLWPIAEQGKAIVRLDGQDRVLWRYTPFFDAAGNFYTMASDGDFVYLTYETPTTPPSVFRLNAATGEPVFFAKDTKAIPLPLAKDTERVPTPDLTRAVGFDLIATGLAADAKHLYVSLFASNEILVLDKTDASLIKRIPVPGPRGLAVGGEGVLFAASYANAAGRIVRVDTASGEVRDVVTSGLSAPWNVAMRDNGDILVTDLGDSQQIKEFSADGKPVRTYGKAGGRPYAGAYQAGDYQKPAGIATDHKGSFVVTEASIPSVITRINSQGEITRQWFGPIAYSSAVWPDPNNPFLIYSKVGSEDGILRSVLDPKSGDWRPDAYWAISSSYTVDRNGQSDLSIHTFADPAFQRFTDRISYPQTVQLGGATYMSSDAPQHPIVRVEGDRLIPVAAAESRDGQLWVGQETNGNGLLETAEWSVAPGISLPPTHRGKPGFLNGHVGSHTLSPYSGNWYLAAGKTIYRIPNASFKKGKLRFDVKEAKAFIEDVTDGDLQGPLPSTYRCGILGMREDAAGNLYVLYTYGGKSAGIGHSSDITRVFLVKFDPQGKRLWAAGRKAASFAKPGEIYNPWVMAGLLGDKAVAISDEAGGMLHFYSLDGFYLGRTFEDYARGDGQPGPYLFNGENFSGRVQEFPAQKEFRYMAYMSQTDARVFVLEGVEAPRKTLKGKVSLTRHYGSQKTDATTATLERIATPPAIDGSLTGWESIPPLAIRNGDNDVADVRVALSKNALFFRCDVQDRSPLLNAEPDPKIAFKGGDAVDLYFGPTGDRNAPGIGDVRLLVGLHKGRATLVGMKPHTEGEKLPQTYSNPAGYQRTFDFVGPIEGAEVTAVKTPGGYAVAGRVPLAFLKPLDFAPGNELRFDADVLGSDPTGQKTATRTFWNSAGDSVLTMTQDLPTEAWLYPAYWGKLKVK